MKWTIFCLLLIASVSFGQNEWSLQRCIDSAMLNNKSILISKLNQQKAAISLQNNVYNFIPSLNGGVTHGYNFGQTIDPFTNQFASKRVQTNNLYLSSSLTLFSGLQNYYDRKILILENTSESLNLLIIERDQRIKVTTQYLQCQLYQETVILATENLRFSENEKIQIEKLIQEGRKTNVELDKANSQIARDEITLQKAENDLFISMINLQQIMGMELDTSFRLKNEIPTLIYSSRQEFPEKELSVLQIEKQNLLIKQYKGQLFPKVSLNGSLGSGYSENNTFQSQNGEFIPKPFQVQLNENLYQTLSASLQIPLYNNHRNNTKIKIAELNALQQKIEYQQVEQELNNKKQLMEIEAEQSRANLVAYQIATQFSETEFKNSQLLYSEGRISYYDFLFARNLLTKAKSEEIQAKYQAILAELIVQIF